MTGLKRRISTNKLQAPTTTHNENNNPRFCSTDSDLKLLGKKIAITRKMLDCTQSVFAEALGITPQTLSLIERGNFQLTTILAAKIYFSLCELIDTDVAEILGLENSTKLAIEEVMTLLEKYIRQLNSSLSSIIKNRNNKCKRSIVRTFK